MTPTSAFRTRLLWLTAMALVLVLFWGAYWLVASRPASYAFVGLAEGKPKQVGRYFFNLEGKSAMEYPGGLVYKFKIDYRELSAIVKNELTQKRWTIDSESEIATLMSGEWMQSVQDSPVVVVRPTGEGNCEVFIYEPATWLGSKIEEFQGHDRSIAATAGS